MPSLSQRYGSFTVRITDAETIDNYSEIYLFLSCFVLEHLPFYVMFHLTLFNEVVGVHPTVLSEKR